MTDVAAAAAATLRGWGRYATVTGPQWDGAQPLVDAAAAHVVAPGPTTRLTVAAGVALGGHRAAVVLDTLPPIPPLEPVLAFTTSAACATDALDAGWSVIQAYAPDDVDALLVGAGTATSAIVLLGDAAPEVAVEAPAARRTRQWFDGDMATLVAAGAAVPVMVHLAQRLHARGVDVAAVEVAVLTDPQQRDLVGGGAVLVAGPGTAGVFRNERWPPGRVEAVALAGAEEADLVGAVLSHVRVG